MFFNFCNRCCNPCSRCYPPAPFPPAPIPPVPPFPPIGPVGPQGPQGEPGEDGRTMVASYYSLSASNISQNEPIAPFVQGYNSAVPGVSLSSDGSTITLAPGNYLVHYSTNATAASAGTIGTSATLNGTTIANSTRTVTAAADSSYNLHNSFVVSVPAGTNATLQLVNTGTNATTFTNSNIVVEQMSNQN